MRQWRDRDDGSIVRLAITQKPGPKGGYTVAIGRYRPQYRKFKHGRDRNDGSILLVAITQKPGPKGGHTVAIGRCRPQQRTTREPESLFSR